MPYEELVFLIIKVCKKLCSIYDTKTVPGCKNNLRQIVTLHTMVHIDIILCTIHFIIFGSYCIHFESGIAIWLCSMSLFVWCAFVLFGDI